MLLETHTHTPKKEEEGHIHFRHSRLHRRVITSKSLLVEGEAKSHYGAIPTRRHRRCVVVVAASFIIHNIYILFRYEKMQNILLLETILNKYITYNTY